MAGDAAERGRVVVVHLADERPSAPAIVGHRHASARRGAGRRARARRRAAWRARSGSTAATRSRRRSNCTSSARAAAVGREKAEQDEAEVAVDRSASRRVLERHRADVVLELAAPLGRRVDEPRGEARGVLEEIADRRRLAVRRRATREDAARTQLVERTAARRHELHHDRRRRDRLGQRREIERRRLVGRRGAGIEGQPSERARARARPRSSRRRRRRRGTPAPRSASTSTRRARSTLSISHRVVVASGCAAGRYVRVHVRSGFSRTQADRRPDRDADRRAEQHVPRPRQRA